MFINVDSNVFIPRSTSYTVYQSFPSNATNLTRHQCNIHFESSRVAYGAEQVEMGAADRSRHSPERNTKACMN